MFFVFHLFAKKNLSVFIQALRKWGPYLFTSFIMAFNKENEGITIKIFFRGVLTNLASIQAGSLISPRSPNRIRSKLFHKFHSLPFIRMGHILHGILLATLIDPPPPLLPVDLFPPAKVARKDEEGKTRNLTKAKTI